MIRIKYLVAALTIAVIFYLTFQKLTDSVALTQWLIKSLHLKTSVRMLRHYIHYFEYGALGLALSAFGWHGIWIGTIIGCIDETVKIWLPGREFDAGDLLRDVVAVTVTVCLVRLGQMFARQYRAKKTQKAER